MTDPDRLDLRDIGEADVYIGGEPSAHLVRQRGDKVSFDYVGEAHPTDRRVRDRSVSWSLLRSGEYPVTTNGWRRSFLLRGAPSRGGPAWSGDIIDENLRR